MRRHLKEDHIPTCALLYDMSYSLPIRFIAIQRMKNTVTLKNRGRDHIECLLALQLSGVSYHVSSNSFVLSFDTDYQCAPRLTANLQPPVQPPEGWDDKCSTPLLALKTS